MEIEKEKLLSDECALKKSGEKVKKNPRTEWKWKYSIQEPMGYNENATGGNL